jgi:hypothetical protein
LFYPKQMRSGRIPHIERIYKSTFGKASLSLLNNRGRNIVLYHLRQYIFHLWKRFLINRTAARKSLIGWMYFEWWRELGWARYTSRILASGVHGIHHVPFPSLLKKVKIGIKYFWNLTGKGFEETALTKFRRWRELRLARHTSRILTSGVHGIHHVPLPPLLKKC